MKKLSLITLGCNKNQTDSEFLLAGLASEFEVTGTLEDAEIIVLSPCSFLGDARDEAKAYIKKLKHYKLEHKCECLVLTGCYAELLKEEVFKEDEDINLVIGLADLKTFVKSINNFFEGNKIKKFVKGNGNIFGLFDERNVNRINSNQNYTYVKISEGCDNRCSYCLIPTIRGSYRSRHKEVILAEVQNLVNNGIKEINIVSQDIGDYGIDIYTKNGKEEYSFIDLLRDMADIKIEGNRKFWIRLLYMHPKHVSKELIKLIKEKDNICKYLDMPVQHVSNKILKDMDRKITKEEIIHKLDMFRKEIPSVTIRTTFILGFPGETEKEFSELCEFVKEGHFDKAGFFVYSNEKGTRSYNLKGQVLESIKLKRAKILKDIQEKVSYDKNLKFLSKTVEFLPDEIIDQNTIKGRLVSMAPEVDGFIYIKYGENVNLIEKFTGKSFPKAKVYDCDSYDLYAKGV